MSVSDILAKIEAYKRPEIAAAKAARPLADLKAMVRDCPPTRGFVTALKQHHRQNRPALIAEIKNASSLLLNF